MVTPGSGAIETILTSKVKDLGEMTVRRTLPAFGRQRVGPFIFFDHMGPADFRPGAGVSVRPHPHIGLATITFLFDGVILHRDSLGYVQPIEPGAVNWMTAGRGIVHSERSPDELIETGSHLHGIQTWLALPEDKEEIEPRFEHYPAADVPGFSRDGVAGTVIAGEAYGEKSPVLTSSETVYVALQLDDGAAIDVPQDVEELGVYAVSGDLSVDGQPLEAGSMAVLKSGAAATLNASGPCRAMLLGGDRLAGKRILWWNFVSSSRDRIERAKRDWQNREFDEVPGETEFIPLPKK